MKPFCTFLILILLFSSCENVRTTDERAFPTVFETSNGKQTATYEEVIDFYLLLAKEFQQINVQTIGTTDSGYPLHLVTYNPEGNFNFQKLRKEKGVLLINNGIHPGEPDGIDATMMLFRDLAKEKIPVPKNTIITTIPVYNIGGMLNRNRFTRINQNGPESYGFRGNARNYDLNRDFIKMDTENAKTFATIFHMVKPDVFIDNHVSNGADYQYTLTHLFTQHNKLGGNLGAYLDQVFLPALESELNASNLSITPYVNVFNRPPDNGFSQFLDHPRYSTGYTTLWNTLGMMVETHMLKPYKQRVEATYHLMQKMIAITDRDHSTIRTLRKKRKYELLRSERFFTGWTLDSTKTKKIRFKGYQADTIPSELTGLPRLKYDRTQTYEKDIPYFATYYPKDTLTIPEAYIVKRGWRNINERLTVNGIDFYELEEDVQLEVESYKIAAYKTYDKPYEGHFPHYATQVESALEETTFRKGDYVVPTRQDGIRYLLETLEPMAHDSFFNWNFFDTVLQQKEGFSPYVFEDLALSIVENNPALKDSLLLKRKDDPDFAEDGLTQLDWVLSHSHYLESAYLSYPVHRVLKEDQLSRK